MHQEAVLSILLHVWGSGLSLHLLTFLPSKCCAMPPALG